VNLEILPGLSGVDPARWNALVGDDAPFLEWAWLASLEESGCTTAATGWLPQHLVLRDGDRWLGACPLYVKSHSQGEFVFDHGWAEAAERGGIRYYPKLLVASPFTPAAGVRLLVAPDADRATVVRTLGTALQSICRDSGFSSVHVNFCRRDEVTALRTIGFEERAGYQFQWISQGWRTFEDYLGALRSKRRNQVRRERRTLEDQGITIETHLGDAIPDELFPPMFRLYLTTVDKFVWGHRYLNESFFDLLRHRWRHRLCFVVARREGRVVAGTFNVRGRDVLYGRYWGAFEEWRHLHFNVCYYAAIELCLREGIGRFEPGAGGAFKYLRGFDARPTSSMHFLADERLATAVRCYLARVRRAVGREIAWMDERSELKRPEGAEE
jgi:predicted N-acyltransferase